MYEFIERLGWFAITTCEREGNIYIGAQSCLTLCDPMNHSLRAPLDGIFQAGILELVTTSACRGSSPSRDQTCLSWIFFFGGGGGAARILECVAIPFSRRSSRPRDWSQVSHIVGRRFTMWSTRKGNFTPPAGDLPHPEIKPASPASPTLAGGFFTTWEPWRKKKWSHSVMSDSLQPHGL